MKTEDTLVENLWYLVTINNVVPEIEFKHLPYDYYCPSVKNLADHVCSVCGTYFLNKTAVNRHKRGFVCLTKRKLPKQLIPVVRPTLDEEIEDMACKENEEDDVIPIITIADTLINASLEEVSVVITGSKLRCLKKRSLIGRIYTTFLLFLSYDFLSLLHALHFLYHSIHFALFLFSNVLQVS